MTWTHQSWTTCILRMLTTRNMEHVLSATPCIGNIYLNTRTGPFQGPLCHFQTDLPMCSKLKLGGGNSNIFYFHPEPWGRFFSQFDGCIFFKWVGKNPPARKVFHALLGVSSHISHWSISLAPHEGQLRESGPWLLGSSWMKCLRGWKNLRKKLMFSLFLKKSLNLEKKTHL